MWKKQSTLGIIAVSIASTMWGFDGVVLTPRLYNLDVTYVVFMLHALPFLGMSLLMFKEYKVLPTLSKSDLIYFFLVAIFGGALGTLAIVKALFLVEFKQLTVVALLQKLQPVFAIILAKILLQEQIKRNFLGWAMMALIGGYFLTFEWHVPGMVRNGKMLEAAGYSLIAAFSFGSATVFGKRVLKSVSFQTALFYRYGFTAAIMFFVVLIGEKFAQIQVTTPQNWLFFVIIGLTTGSGAILLYYYGLRFISAKVSTICELCFPISTVLFDYLVNGNVLRPIQWCSAGIMLFAIYKISGTQTDENALEYAAPQFCDASR